MLRGDKRGERRKENKGKGRGEIAKAWIGLKEGEANTVGEEAPETLQTGTGPVQAVGVRPEVRGQRAWLVRAGPVIGHPKRSVIGCRVTGKAWPRRPVGVSQKAKAELREGRERKLVKGRREGRHVKGGNEKSVKKEIEEREPK